jgi:hypothetical protein
MPTKIDFDELLLGKRKLYEDKSPKFKMNVNVNPVSASSPIFNV